MKMTSVNLYEEELRPADNDGMKKKRLTKFWASWRVMEKPTTLRWISK